MGIELVIADFKKFCTKKFLQIRQKREKNAKVSSRKRRNTVLTYCCKAGNDQQCNDSLHVGEPAKDKEQLFSGHNIIL